MTDVGTSEEWAADRIYRTEPSPRHPDPAEPALVGGAAAVDLDAGTGPDEVHPDTGAKRIALGLVGALLVSAIGIAIVMAGPGDEHTSATPSPPVGVAPVVPAPVPTTAATPPDQDRAIPYTASANCPAGSTSAQSLTGAATDSAWTCVRGQQGARVDGQVLHVDLGGSHVLTAVSVTPGWVPKTPGGRDDWLRHRVVTRLQYVFDDTARTIFTQDTGNVHGPVTAALPTRVLAAKVTVIVLQTSRPPASPPVTADPALPGFGDGVLGPSGAPVPPDGEMVTDPPTAEDTGEDPVDATFSISTLTFLGHQPT